MIKNMKQKEKSKGRITKAGSYGSGAESIEES